ncbi:pimeloyl-ACP methyl ester carboxylesterase [Paenibacillus forsythiae]|uniref:Pimeloyl-ACP methyl ester carboxylesterase n=1 Tax=Paenibacillus forsythiae TaxID=365616 RepID=A0ABU3HE22_9BACL|nr:alpha/beta hydrolase [Paenibacillus forsythiae]MDT3428297.1 pimeloyl-ACP methyl ester carboxylesterase [Paenibacillus forsythiae]
MFNHGAFVTASFEPLMGYFKARGFEVLAPVWPSHDQSVPELRNRPESGLGKIGLDDLTEYYAGIIKELPEKPVIIGHSFGGLLLMIAGEVDRIVPASLVRKNYSLYNRQSGAVTDYKEFPGRSHWIIAQPGWEEVADFIYQWLKEQLPDLAG